MLSLVAFDALVAWFRQVRTAYFFRQERTPYRVWVAEVVLQQTRVEAALAPLARFLAAFPDVESLAHASEEEVLCAFRGLGYYGRARHLHRAAQIVCAKHGGRLPETYAELCRLPSIGQYTAAAIGSISFGLREPVVDGNVKRILARTELWDALPSSAAFTRQAYARLRPLFVEMTHAAGEVNEALMELGQKVCVKSHPRCHECPLAIWCRAHNQRQVEHYPRVKVKVSKIPVVWHIYILRDSQSRVLLQRWQNFYFLKGHLALPSLLEFPTSGRTLASWQSTSESPSITELGEIAEELASVRHTITYHSICIRPYVGRAKESAVLPEGMFWQPMEIVAELLVASALNKVWQKFCQYLLL
jgi:A/G-specific adenine glycosylase